MDQESRQGGDVNPQGNPQSNNESSDHTISTNLSTKGSSKIRKFTNSKKFKEHPFAAIVQEEESQDVIQRRKIKRRIKQRKIRKDVKKKLRSSRIDIFNWKNIYMRRVRRNVLCFCGQVHTKRQDCNKKPWVKYFMKWQKGESGKRFKKICRYCGQVGDLTVKKHQKCALIYKMIPIRDLITKDRKIINSKIEKIEGKVTDYVIGDIDQLTVQRFIKSILIFILINAKQERYLTQRGPIKEQPELLQVYEEALGQGGYNKCMIKGKQSVYQRQKQYQLQDLMDLLKFCVKGKQPSWEKRNMKKAFIAFMNVIGNKNMTLEDMKTFKTDRGKLWPFVRDRWDNVRYRQVLSSFGHVTPAIYYIPAHIIKQIQDDEDSFQMQAATLINQIGARKVTQFQLEKIKKQFKIHDQIVEVLCRKQFQMVHFSDQLLDEIQQFEMYCCNIKKFIQRTKFQPFFKIKCTKKQVVLQAKDIIHEWIQSSQQIDEACDDLRKLSYKIIEEDILGKLSLIKIQKNQIRQSDRQIVRQGVPLVFQELVQIMKMHEVFKNQNMRMAQVVFHNKLEPGQKWITLKYPDLFEHYRGDEMLKQQAFIFVNSEQDQKMASLKLITGMLQTIYHQVKDEWFQFGKRRFLPRIQAPTIVPLQKSGLSDEKLLKYVGERKLWVPKDVYELKNSSFISQMVGFEVIKKKPRGFAIQKSQLDKLQRFCSTYSISIKTIKLRIEKMSQLSKYSVYDVRRYQEKRNVLIPPQSYYVRPNAILDEIKMIRHWLFKFGQVKDDILLNSKQLTPDVWKWLFNGLLYTCEKKASLDQIIEKMSKVLTVQKEIVRQQVVKMLQQKTKCYQIQVLSGGTWIQLRQVLESLKLGNQEIQKLDLEPQIGKYTVQRGSCQKCRLRDLDQSYSEQVVMVDQKGNQIQEIKNCCKPLKKIKPESKIVQSYPVFRHIVGKIVSLGTRVQFQKKQNNFGRFFLNTKYYKHCDFNIYHGRASKKIIQAKMNGITKADEINIRQSVQKSFYLPLQIAKSTIQNAGNGVFATKDLQKGTVIGVYSGQIYLLDQAPQDDLKSQVQMGYVDDELLIMVPTRKFNHGRYLNGAMDGFQANVLATRVITDIGRGKEIIMVLMVSEKVKAGTQLRWNYRGTFEKY